MFPFKRNVVAVFFIFTDGAILLYVIHVLSYRKEVEASFCYRFFQRIFYSIIQKFLLNDC